MHKTEMHIAAQELIYYEIPVIPLIGKKPAIPWKEFQTRLPTQKELLGWFTEKTRHNLGIVTGSLSGITVKDFDDMDLAREYFREHRDRIKTVVLTPRPGVHFYFKYSGQRNSQGDKQDLRGEGGFVACPPSEIDGRPYRYLDGFVNVPPSQLCEMPEEQSKPKIIQEIPIEEEDRIARVSRAIAYVDKCDPSISGQSGHSALYRVCCKLVRKFELTDSEAWPILLRYNERAVPPWSESDLRRKLKEAQKGA